MTKTQSGQTATYSYDVLGNLRFVQVPEGITIEYVIDGRNRRVGKKVNGTLVRAWLYQGGLAPIAELDGAGVVTTQFVYGSQGNVPDYFVRGGQIYRVVTDYLGSVRWVLNAETGAVAQRMEYDVFGRVLLDTNPGYQPFGFAGGLYDYQTGLVRFGVRDYDAEMGRWTAKDPILFGGGTADLYEYCGNDPTNLTDPSGRGGPAVVAVALAVWGAVEVGLSIWDAYDTYRTITDPAVSNLSKVIAGSLFLGGLAGPGGGYGVADDLAEHVDDVGEAFLRPYGGKGGGHHVPAKSGFEDAPGFDVNAAPAIPNEELLRLGVSHSTVTGAQMTGYRAFAETGESLTWEAMQTIETNALVRGGLAPDAASATVATAIRILQELGVAGPTRIPWGG